MSQPKAKTTGFQPHGDIPRFIPLQNGEILFRNPVTGRNERSTLPVLVERLEGEFKDHQLNDSMVHDLADIAATRLLNHLDPEVIRANREALVRDAQEAA